MVLSCWMEWGKLFLNPHSDGSIHMKIHPQSKLFQVVLFIHPFIINPKCSIVIKTNTQFFLFNPYTPYAPCIVYLPT